MGSNFVAVSHPLATCRERWHWCADADRHGGKFRHRDGWDADAVHCRPAERQFRLGAGGRRGFRRGVRAGEPTVVSSLSAADANPAAEKTAAPASLSWLDPKRTAQVGSIAHELQSVAVETNGAAACRVAATPALTENADPLGQAADLPFLRHHFADLLNPHDRDASFPPVCGNGCPHQ